MCIIYQNILSYFLSALFYASATIAGSLKRWKQPVKEVVNKQNNFYEPIILQ